MVDVGSEIWQGSNKYIARVLRYKLLDARGLISWLSLVQHEKGQFF